MTTYRVVITGQQKHITANNNVYENQTESQVWAIIEKLADKSMDSYENWDNSEGESFEINNDYYMSVELQTADRNKQDYEVFNYNSGYFGISRIGNHGGNPIYGGDSACEDHYNQDYIMDVYNNWDGTLVNCGNNKYGESGFKIEA